MNITGKTLPVLHGAFKGFDALVKNVVNDVVYAEIVIFGRKTETTLTLSDLVEEEFIPSYRDLKDILEEFDILYGEKAPLRYKQLRKGLSKEKIEKLSSSLHAATLPDDYITLYSWANGMKNPPSGWRNEMMSDSWYELVPLDSTGHFIGISDAAGLIEMWQEIAVEAKEKGEPCYWKKGFIPFIELQHYGLVVVDTVGYWGGKAGQIVSFDYKCANGYYIVAESLGKWWEEKLQLLKNDLFFNLDDHDHEAEHRITEEVNGYYTRKFPSEIKLNR